MTDNKTPFRMWCVDNGLTAKDISERTGISLHTVFAYMSGRRNPNRRNMKKISDAYKVNVQDLFPL